MMKRNTVLIVICSVLALAGCSSKQLAPLSPTQSPYEAGKSEAHASVTKDKLSWKLCGQPAGHDALFKQILKEQYKVDLLIVAGCKVPEEMGQNVKGYNEVMTKAIVNRFGKDIIPLAEQKAKEQFQERNRK